MRVFLHWRWNDSKDHSERKAPYASLADAKAQAAHDLQLCEASGDYSTAPERITGEDGAVLWSRPEPLD